MTGQLLAKIGFQSTRPWPPLGAMRRMLLKTVDREGSLFQSLMQALSGEGRITNSLPLRDSDVKMADKPFSEAAVLLDYSEGPRDGRSTGPCRLAQPCHCRPRVNDLMLSGSSWLTCPVQLQCAL
jgi:hypothetical protein